MEEEAKKIELKRGNIGLPFGLCKKFGIELPDNATPRDAWDKLAGKGLTPDNVYAQLKKQATIDLPEKKVEVVEPEKETQNKTKANLNATENQLESIDITNPETLATLSNKELDKLDLYYNNKLWDGDEVPDRRELLNEINKRHKRGDWHEPEHRIDISGGKKRLISWGEKSETTKKVAPKQEETKGYTNENGKIKFNNKQALVDFVKQQTNTDLTNDEKEMFNNKRDVLYTTIPQNKRNEILSLFNKFGIKAVNHLKDRYYVYLK